MIDFTSIVSFAVSNNLNIVASSNDEHQITGDLLKSLETLNSRLIHLDLELFGIIDLFTNQGNPDEQEPSLPSYIFHAGVLAFSRMELAAPEMLKAIDELLEKRTLRGIKLPNLQSVVVSFDFADEPEEIIRLQKLAPAVTVAFS
jgi:hypothetical protein